ncbi:hypothetical protein CsSME_00021479 [Camellia sinensis var. sinensis]
MSQERGEEPYCERDASRAGLLEMRPFGEAKSISGHQTLQLMRRPYGVRSKGKRVRCHTPCLPKVPRGRARRSRATTRERIPHRQGDRRRPSRGTSRPTGNTGETWEGNPIGSQRIHSTCSLPDFIFIIFESGGKGSLFCNGKKNGADLTRHNLTIHPIPMICA